MTAAGFHGCRSQNGYSDGVEFDTNKQTKDIMAALNDMLVIMDDYDLKQKQLWQNVHQSIKNNTIPDKLPDEAVLFVSGDMFDKLPSQLKEGLSGKLFTSIILPDDQMVIMNRKDLPPMHNRPDMSK